MNEIDGLLYTEYTNYLPVVWKAKKIILINGKNALDLVCFTRQFLSFDWKSRQTDKNESVRVHKQTLL